MIMSPLGAIMMPALNMTPQQFGLVVSVYAFSAGGAGFIAAGFADRYDRKKLLLLFYVGFRLGTLFCALAPTFPFLVGARLVTGLFGGVVGSTVFAIITDVFDFGMRGRVMGFIQTAFAASQVLVLPAGLYISSLWGWHAPFMMIVAIGAVVGVFIFIYLKPIDAHLGLPSDRSAFRHLVATLSNRRYLFAFAATALLSIGGFMLMPFSSAFTVHNLGIEFGKIPLIYLITGLCAIFIGPLVGRAGDKFGKYLVFVIVSVISVIMVLVYTNLGVTPLPFVMLENVVMSVGSSIQQIAGGIASVVAGMIVVARADGYLEHFEVLGYIMVGTAAVSVCMMYFIDRSVAFHINSTKGFH